MRLNNSILQVIYDKPSLHVHWLTLLITVGYGLQHLFYGVTSIGVFALGSAVFCALTVINIFQRTPKPIHYYGIMVCQIFALILTAHHFGLRGLVLVPPFLAGVFFLFPFKNATVLASIIVPGTLIAAYPSIETGLYIRVAIAQIVTLFFTILFSHVVMRQQAMLESEANFDYLTDIPNRRGFTRWLSKEIELVRSQDSDLAFFYLDLDKFKSINDQYGHNVGDELLVTFSNRIVSALRNGDLIRESQQVSNFARLSGDEFVLAIPKLQSTENAKKIATRILEIIDRPFRFKELQVRSGVSIGVAFASDAEFDMESLFHKADLALYQSKKAGGNTVTIYAEEHL